MTITLNIDSDVPVLVLVVPERKSPPSVRPFPAARRVIDTTGEELPADASNVVPLRRAG